MSETATELLSKWQDTMYRRSIAISSRTDNSMLPPPGPLERIALQREDLNQVMWFLNRTLIVLAAHERAMNAEPSP